MASKPIKICPHPSFALLLVIYLSLLLYSHRTSLVAQTVKCLSTMWETRVQSLGREDLLEKG